MSQKLNLSATLSVSYRQVPQNLDPLKPTLVLLHSFTTTLDLFEPQLNDIQLLNTCNLLAIDEIGHGQTTSEYDTTQWTYWTTAQMVIDLIKKLEIEGPIFIAGVSQGGFIAARILLLEPRLVQGLFLLGTSMYGETEETRKLGCWDVREASKEWFKFLDKIDGNVDFQVPYGFTEGLTKNALDENVTRETIDFWVKTHHQVYNGSNGQKKLRQCAVCLIERDGLDERLKEIHCPVLIIHGTRDNVYSVPLAKKMQQDLSNAHLEIIEGGYHFLSASRPKEVNKLMIQFIISHNNSHGPVQN